MELKTNKEFAMRHCFALAVFLGMGAWFGYDAFIRYPSTPPRELYAQIERSDAPETMSESALGAFKSQKTATQRMLAAVSLLAGAWVALGLLAVARSSFSFDEDGFSSGKKRFAWSDIAGIDLRDWDKKGILRFTVSNGMKFKLDAWHHNGVQEFKEELEKKAK